eukprot:g4248.t1
MSRSTVVGVPTFDLVAARVATYQAAQPKRAAYFTPGEEREAAAALLEDANTSCPPDSLCELSLGREGAFFTRKRGIGPQAARLHAALLDALSRDGGLSIRRALVWMDFPEAAAVSKGSGAAAEAPEAAEDLLRLLVSQNKTAKTRQTPLLVDLSKWMGAIDDGTALKDLVIPGTHGSGAVLSRSAAASLRALGDDGILAAEGAAGMVIAQTLTVREQLARGVRALDLRIDYVRKWHPHDHRCCPPPGTEPQSKQQHQLAPFKPGLFVFHGPYAFDLSFESILRGVGEFLLAHPSETVLVKIKQEGTSQRKRWASKVAGTHTSATILSPEPFAAKVNDAINEVLFEELGLPVATAANTTVTPDTPLGTLRGRLVVVVNRHFPAWLKLPRSVACSELVRKGEEAGLSSIEGEYPSSYRSSERLLFRSPKLATALWRRLVPWFTRDDIEGARPAGLDAGGIWKPAGLNDVFRLSRYEEGCAFRPHRDGTFVVNAGLRSVLTLMVYLNGDSGGGDGDGDGSGGSIGGSFDGGETRWFRGGSSGSAAEEGKLEAAGNTGDDDDKGGAQGGRGGEVAGGDGRGSEAYHQDQILWTRAPVTGLGVMFPHPLLHEGRPVLRRTCGNLRSAAAGAGAEAAAATGDDEGESKAQKKHGETTNSRSSSPGSCRKYVLRTDVLFMRLDRPAGSLWRQPKLAAASDGGPPPPPPVLVQQESARYAEMSDLFDRSTAAELAGDTQAATELYLHALELQCTYPADDPRSAPWAVANMAAGSAAGERADTAREEAAAAAPPAAEAASSSPTPPTSASTATGKRRRRFVPDNAVALFHSFTVCDLDADAAAHEAAVRAFLSASAVCREWRDLFRRDLLWLLLFQCRWPGPAEVIRTRHGFYDDDDDDDDVVVVGSGGAARNSSESNQAFAQKAFLCDWPALYRQRHAAEKQGSVAIVELTPRHVRALNFGDTSPKRDCMVALRQGTWVSIETHHHFQRTMRGMDEALIFGRKELEYHMCLSGPLRFINEDGSFAVPPAQFFRQWLVEGAKQLGDVMDRDEVLPLRLSDELCWLSRGLYGTICQTSNERYDWSDESDEEEDEEEDDDDHVDAGATGDGGDGAGEDQEGKLPVGNTGYTTAWRRRQRLEDERLVERGMPPIVILEALDKVVQERQREKERAREKEDKDEGDEEEEEEEEEGNAKGRRVGKAHGLESPCVIITGDLVQHVAGVRGAATAGVMAVLPKATVRISAEPRGDAVRGAEEHLVNTAGDLPRWEREASAMQESMRMRRKKRGGGRTGNRRKKDAGGGASSQKCTVS